LKIIRPFKKRSEEEERDRKLVDQYLQRNEEISKSPLPLEEKIREFKKNDESILVAGPRSKFMKDFQKVVREKENRR